MLIELIKSFLLGVIEGITEWLPISSTGHLILAEQFIKLDVSDAFWQMFLVVIQLGAIMAVVLLYFKKLFPFFWARGRDFKPSLHSSLSLWGKIILAVIPAAVVGIPLSDWMDEHLMTPQVVSATLIIYGIIFIVLERHNRKLDAKRGGAHFADTALASSYDSGHANGMDARHNTVKGIEEMSIPTAVGIGVFQVLSLVPGTSRSGSTILGGMILGCTRETAAEFSFFLAIPVMAGASLLKVVKFLLNNSFSGTEWAILAVGVISAFLVSILAIRFLMNYIRNNDFSAFGWYRIVVGVVFAAYFLFIV
jgi:undecaprenyl-diphosphatase